MNRVRWARLACTGTAYALDIDANDDVNRPGRAAARRAERLVEADARVGRFGREYCQVLAELTDDWVIELFDDAMRSTPPKSGRVAMLAVGGYGRGELAPGSDLDLLLVHDVKPKKIAKDLEPTASALWYPIWDAGVKLGHAVRRIDEHLELARTDLDTATALLTARPIAGDAKLAAQVVAQGPRTVGRTRRRWLARAARRVREREDVGGTSRTASSPT